MMMLETNGSLVDDNSATSPARSVQITLALPADWADEYTDMLRAVIDLALEASAFTAVEIHVVDPTADDRAIDDHDQAFAVPAAPAVNTQQPEPKRVVGTGCANGSMCHRHLEARAIAA